MLGLSSHHSNDLTLQMVGPKLYMLRTTNAQPGAEAHQEVLITLEPG